MSSKTNTKAAPPLDLTKWRVVPTVLMVLGGLGALIGAYVDLKQFAFGWLLAYMLFLGLVLGSLFLVMAHHLFDASWSVGIRRFLEHLANLSPIMAALFIPLAVLAPKIYPWMQLALAGKTDHALSAKKPLLTLPMFYIVSFACLAIWVFVARVLRTWSLRQDETGAAECTYRMRFHSYWGMAAFAATVTMAAILWMKALMHEWFSTMFGVYYFAGSVWMTLATAYVIAVLLKRQGPLRDLVGEEQFYFLGSLLFAFTVFFAYVTFAQYFIIWNANMPEETFWFVLREKGTWWDIGMVIIFGHFFVPFLALLRIDAKLALPVMLPLAIWAWLMRYCDLSFNIMPVLHPGGYVLHWIDISCILFMAGLLATFFLKSLAAHPPYPLRDPRLAESLKVYIAPVAAPTEPQRAGKPAQ